MLNCDPGSGIWRGPWGGVWGWSKKKLPLFLIFFGPPCPGPPPYRNRSPGSRVELWWRWHRAMQPEAWPWFSVGCFRVDAGGRSHGKTATNSYQQLREPSLRDLLQELSDVGKQVLLPAWRSDIFLVGGILATFGIVAFFVWERWLIKMGFSFLDFAIGSFACPEGSVLTERLIFVWEISVSFLLCQGMIERVFEGLFGKSVFWEYDTEVCLGVFVV